jgi:tetratricopeptide (TPR) repeat protein
MIKIRSLSCFALAGALFLTAGVAMAQHDVGGGSTTGAATGGDSNSRGTTAVKRVRTTPSTARRPRPPVKRGITAEQYNQQGDELFEAKQYDDALELYLKAVQLKPIALAYYHIGWIYNDREDYDQAVTALQQSVRLEPSDAVVLNELGYAYRSLKRYDEAIAAYRRAISVKSDYATPYYQIGWIYNDQAQYAQAIEPLRRAAALRADYAEANEELGYACFKLNRSQEAIAAYQNAVQIKPDYGPAYLGLGDTYFYQTKQYALAAEAYQQGVRYKDDNPTAFYNLAWCYNELGRNAQAMAAAKRAIALQAAYPEAFVELGFANRRVGEAQQNPAQAQRLFNEAVNNYREAIRLKPGYGDAYTGLGDVYYGDLKQYQEAVAAYEQSIRISPNNSRVRYNLGYSYNDLERYAEAANHLREAIQLKPEYVEAHSELGFAYLKLGRLPAAVETLRTAIRLKGNYATAHYYMGLVHIAQRNRVGAQAEYAILQRLDPKLAQKLFDASPPNMRN